MLCERSSRLFSVSRSRYNRWLRLETRLHSLRNILDPCHNVYEAPYVDHVSLAVRTDVYQLQQDHCLRFFYINNTSSFSSSFKNVADSWVCASSRSAKSSELTGNRNAGAT